MSTFQVGTGNIRITKQANDLRHVIDLKLLLLLLKNERHSLPSKISGVLDTAISIYELNKSCALDPNGIKQSVIV